MNPVYFKVILYKFRAGVTCAFDVYGAAFSTPGQPQPHRPGPGLKSSLPMFYRRNQSASSSAEAPSRSTHIRSTVPSGPIR